MNEKYELESAFESLKSRLNDLIPELRMCGAEAYKLWRKLDKYTEATGKTTRQVSITWMCIHSTKAFLDKINYDMSQAITMIECAQEEIETYQDKK